MHRGLAVVAIVTLVSSSTAASGEMLAARHLHSAASQAPDLEFPAQPSDLSASSTPTMALYKPEGQGPFPALVLHHQCGGLGNARWQNMSMLSWAREAVSHGYVALLIDSLGPRHVDQVCMGARGGVNLPRGVKDVLQAAEHLRKLSFVDKKRVALAGYSWGAIVGVLASSKHWGRTLASGERFAAVVSFYPGCFSIPTPGGAFDIVNTDIDRPLLVLMGDKDSETPPRECIPGLEAARSAGAPVKWHVYPSATHCWDCENLDGFSKVDFRGNRVVYHYDRDVTQDSARRMFDFLQGKLNARP